MPTTRNARGIDIIAYSPDGSRFVTVQVKALSKRDPVPLGTSLDKLMGEFWVIVTNIAIAREPRVFVFPIEEVRRLAHRAEKDGRVSYWLEPASYDTEEFCNAWHRIGRGDVIA